MPHSLASIDVHLVFSTKQRRMWIKDTFRDDLHAYIGVIVHQLGGRLLRAGSVEVHIHLLIAHPRTCTPSQLVKEVKTGSSRWIKGTPKGYRGFQWQSGYGVFSVSPSHRVQVEKYLDNQKAHHKRVTFQDEFRRLLQKYEIQVDEKYLWD